MIKMNRQTGILSAFFLYILIIASSGCGSDDYFSSTADKAPAGGIFRLFPGCGNSVDYSLEKADPEILQQAVKLSARYLSGVCKPGGEFEYRVNMDPDVRFKPSYNMLRHAGTLYALAVYAERSGDKNVHDVILRASGFLKEKISVPVPGRSDMLAVAPYPAVEAGDKDSGLKLGGAGLALVALCSIERIMPGTTPVGYLQKLGRFIIFMQKKDGSFYSKYNIEEKGLDDRWTSLYYPGEAALGLLMLYRLDRSPEWLQAAASAVGYLARIRAGSKDVPPDHWALLATAEFLPLYDRCSNTISKKAIIEHAVRICRGILSADPGYSKNAPEYGSMTMDSITCKTATRLEGILSARAFLPDEYSGLREDIKSAADRGIAFLIRSQVKNGPYTGGIPRAIRQMSKSHPHYSENFNRRAGEIRIDYVQHAMCAVIQYEDLFSGKIKSKIK